MTSTTDGAAGGRLEGRLIGLGVCGSIAAYKAVELLRRLTAEGADVVVMLTPSATRFVGPLTFEALSRHPVETDVLDLLPDQRIGHIVIADTADAIVVAPATARWLGAMANGIADDAVLAACLATTAPVVVAPAMDGDMWTHPATRDNVERLRREFGYRIVEPESGLLASGQSGIGRLAELDDIVDAVVEARRRHAGPTARRRRPAARSSTALHALDLEGRHVVVTAGGTAEPIDPVRFIGNRSSGKMGVAIAEAAVGRGAPGHADRRARRGPGPAGDRRRPRGVDRRRCATPSSRPCSWAAPTRWSWPPPSPTSGRTSAAATKLTRDAGLTLELEPTEDILAEVGARAGELDPAPGHRRVRGRDGLARPGTREAAPQGRRPARGQRRRRGGLGLRHRHEPGLDPRRRRVARRPAAADQARGRGPAAGSGRAAVGRTRGAGADWPTSTESRT